MVKVKKIDKIEKKLDRLITKGISKKSVSKKILKPSQASVTISEYKAPSVLGDPNRFFKGEMEDVKRNMFFE